MNYESLQAESPPIIAADEKLWAPITKVADCFGCSVVAMHRWGRDGKFGYKQLGPKRFIVCISETVAFYRSKYPNIEIDQNLIQSYACPIT